MLGVLACPNLPLASIVGKEDSQKGVGCLFFAKIGSGTYMQSLDGSSLIKVGHIRYIPFLLLVDWEILLSLLARFSTNLLFNIVSPSR